MKLKEAFKDSCLFAFNIDDFVVLKAVLEAFEETGKPLIVQLSEGEVNWWGMENFFRITFPWQKRGGVFLNIDHGSSWPVLEKAIQQGFDMVHFDGSDLPWEENITQTRKVVEMAHSQGVLVEGEPQADWTEVKKAAEFQRKTGVDLVAVFAGNRHGMDPQKPEHLDFSQLRALKEAVGEETGLTLHGGSGVPLEELERAIKEKLVVKVNINTLLRITYREEVEKSLAHYQGLRIYELMKPVKESLQEKVKLLLSLG